MVARVLPITPEAILPYRAFRRPAIILLPFREGDNDAVMPLFLSVGLIIIGL